MSMRGRCFYLQPQMLDSYVSNIWPNKLERLSMAGLSSLVLYLQKRSRAYPRVEHLKGRSALPANLILD
jgi:hypothetical protein